MPYAFDLADDERRELLRIARATLREWVDSGRIPPGKPHRAALVAPASVAVTVTGPGGARTARSDGERPLYRAIQEAVVAAAQAQSPALDDDGADVAAIAIEIAAAAGPYAFADPPRTT